MLNNLDARQLRLIAVGGWALLAAALFAYLVLPQIKTYRTAEENRQVLRKAAQAGEAVSAQLATLNLEIDGLQRRLHGDTANLPEKQLESFVIGRLQNISWTNQVELMVVEPRMGETVQMFRENLFEIELTGSYRGLFEWLADVSDELGFVVIKEYEMRPVDAEAADPRLHVALTLASYRVADS
jgi:Tfp pilus assembly protein PilO